MGPGRHTGLGKKRGAILRAHQKKDFGAIPYFLEITNVGEAYLIFEKISRLPKVFSTNSPNRLKTLSVFFKTLSVLAKHFSKVFCNKEAYLIFEKISVLLKVFSIISPNRLKTLSVFSKHFLFWQNTFQKCFESVLSQNTSVLCHTLNNC